MSTYSIIDDGIGPCRTSMYTETDPWVYTYCKIQIIKDSDIENNYS